MLTETGREDPANCQVDDQVRIGIPEEVVLRGSLLVYLLPLLTALAGTALASSTAAGEGATIVGAALGFALGFGLVRLHAWRHRDDTRLHPVLLEIVRPAATELSLR